MASDESRDSIEVLLEALRDQPWPARVDALRAITAALVDGAFDPAREQSLLPALASAAADPKWEVRKEAAAALGECRHHDEDINAHLARLAGDENRWVSQAAERGIKRMRARTTRAKQWELSPDAQDPMLRHIHARIKEIGLRSMTPAQIRDLAMESSEQSYRELAADTAHELRTLLTPFEGYLAELRRHLATRGGDPIAERYLAAAFERLRQIQLLTENIRAYSSPVSASFEPVDVAAVVRDAITIGHRADNAAPAIAHVLEVPEGIVIDALRERLVRAIANLVANACQAMRTGGTLTVRARLLDAETLTVEIVDTGPGMTPEMIEQARMRFATTRRDEGGTGLGVPIAERIVVDDHGGDLSFESAIGVGTTVTLILPVRRSIDR